MVSRPTSTATQTGRILLEKQASEQNREDEDMAKYVAEYGAN